MRNLEAKFRLRDVDDARARALAIGYSDRALLHQRDTFFRVPKGKLKLREEPSGAWLIHYGREVRDSLQLSQYEIVPIADAAATRAMMSATLGVIAEVRKERTLLMRANVRLHLDRVEGLGLFGEIEAVIADGEDPERSRAAVDELLAVLGIARGDLIDVSYFELAAQAAPPK
ncbi:MAG TPA: class IV adenylate cyclase [Candidatus Binataceae bacterium]|nr:class IV adenylate cyclase [Candidatus Binataceae bacterium]